MAQDATRTRVFGRRLPVSARSLIANQPRSSLLVVASTEVRPLQALSRRRGGGSKGRPHGNTRARLLLRARVASDGAHLHIASGRS